MASSRVLLLIIHPDEELGIENEFSSSEPTDVENVGHNPGRRGQGRS